MNRYMLLFLSCFVALLSRSQSQFDSCLTPSGTLNISRRNAVVISEVSLASLALIGLNQLWYSDFERSNFKTINDSN